MLSSNGIGALKGKIKLQAMLTLLTGLHIGMSNDFASIGAVDSVVVRDPLTKRPIIPGSSLKGKLRTLLARATTDAAVLGKPDQDPDVVKRLFGTSNPVVFSRLQFYDAFMTEESVNRITRMDTDLYLTEIKFENSIDRLSGIANPRQIERVPAGAEFEFRLIYNVENVAQVPEDLAALALAIKLLQLDYLGGHGSRGYGRVACRKFTVHVCPFPAGGQTPIKVEAVANIFKGAGLDVVSAV